MLSLISSGLSSNMWEECVFLACYVLNRIPHKKSEKHFWIMEKYAPNLNYFKAWGFLAKVLFLENKNKKTNTF